MVTQSVPVELPKETNIVTITKPENVLLSIDREGEVFWNTQHIKDNDELVSRLKIEAVKNPQPEVHIRGDLNARYEMIGRVVFACQRASIITVGFITEPPARN